VARLPELGEGLGSADLDVVEAPQEVARAQILLRAGVLHVQHDATAAAPA
jgi:hypothetical protein